MAHSQRLRRFGLTVREQEKCRASICDTTTLRQDFKGIGPIRDRLVNPYIATCWRFRGDWPVEMNKSVSFVMRTHRSRYPYTVVRFPMYWDESIPPNVSCPFIPVSAVDG